MTALANPVLGHCTAIACCTAGAALRSIEHFAAATGLGRVAHYEELASLGALPNILFFLIHFGISDQGKQALLHQIRAHPDLRIRFAPVILISRDLDTEKFLSYVEMGFDDILCLPDAAKLLSDRLLNQLNRDILYIETSKYLGPDRRRLDMPGHPQSGRVSTSRMHVRLYIHRGLAEGPAIVKRQEFWSRSDA